MTSFGPQKPPAQGTFCTQANGSQGVINDRGQCVAQAPLFSPSTMNLYNPQNIENPLYDLNDGSYGFGASKYIMNVDGVDNTGDLPMGQYSGLDQSAMMMKSKQEVERAYQLYLGRGADSGGLDYYAQKVMEAALFKNPDGIKAVMDEIKNSPEGQAYASSQLRPEARTAEKSNQPPPQTPPISQEPPPPQEPPPTQEPPQETSTGRYTASDINGVFRQLLGRDAAEDGLNFWLNAVNTDYNLEDLIFNITNSDEYKSKQTNYLAEGSFLGKQCSGTTMITMTADGQGGAVQSEAPNSAECGYTAPLPDIPGLNLGANPYTSSPLAGIGSVTGYNYSPYAAQARQTQMQPQVQGQDQQNAERERVDYVKQIQGWLTNSLFKDII